MHCRECAEKFGLPTESRVYLARCVCCGERRGCYSEKVADVKLLLEPREAIKNRIREINSELDSLQPLVDKYNAIYQERLRLREEHLRLEHLLTTVPVTKVAASSPSTTKKPSRTAKQVLKQLTEDDRAILLALLEKEAKGNA